jgi:hypothetical protein
MAKKTIVTVLLLVMLVGIVSSCYALTANIGNARMILRAQVGDTIERSVLVKNVNNVTVKIDAVVVGDLAKDLVLKNSNFTLEPNQEKNIDFKVKVTKNGTSETKINIGFSPTDGKGGAVGLTSTIIIIAGGDSVDDTPTSIASNFKLSTTMIGIIITAIVIIVFVIILIIYLKKGSKGEKLNKPKKL